MVGILSLESKVNGFIFISKPLIFNWIYICYFSINQVSMKKYLCNLAKSYMDQIIEHFVTKQLSNDERYIRYLYKTLIF